MVGLVEQFARPSSTSEYSNSNEYSVAVDAASRVQLAAGDFKQRLSDAKPALFSTRAFLFLLCPQAHFLSPGLHILHICSTHMPCACRSTAPCHKWAMGNVEAKFPSGTK